MDTASSMAQSDVRLTGDQLAGLIPSRSGNILSWGLIIFSMVIFSPTDSRAVVSFWQKNVHKYWLPT